MKKNKKLKLFSLIFMILFCCAFQTIVYSAINGTLTVKGDAYARVEADVRITDFRLAKTNKATSSYEEFGKSHIVTEVDLTDATSSITYYIEITNYGSADIGIFDINGLPSGVNYSIKDYNLHDKICDDTGNCNSFIKKTYEMTLTTTGTYAGNVQLNFDFRTYHTVTYTDIENKGYPTEVIDGGTLKIPFQEDLKRVQLLYNNREILFYKTVANGQTVTLSNITKDLEVKIKPQVARMVKGNIDEIGGEVCIGEECFYIISNDGSTVTMLAKYNLYVGGVYDGSTYKEYGNEATGMQEPTMKGWVSNGQPKKGTTFYLENKIEEYVNNYKNSIELFGVNLLDARLITKNELIDANTFACVEHSSCSNDYPWIYSTSYWSGTMNDNEVWAIYSDNVFSKFTYYHSGRDFGVRPVIELDVDEIRPLVRVESGDTDTAGSEICIGDECFYVISSDTDSITMLAKYNLYVGGVHDGTTWTAYGNEATGKQDSTMLGYIEGQTLRNGTTIFSTTNYWESTTSSYPAYVYNKNATIYNYVENYKAYLSTLGSTPKGARVITYEELEALGCDGGNYSCSGAPRWVYSTSYWTGSAAVGWKMWYLYSHSKLTFNYNTEDRYFGVRPVITISKLELSTKIKFTINSTTYYATKGMTWSEWLNSNLSPEEMEQYATNGVYYPEFSYAYIYQNGTQVLFNEQIINNGEYTAKANGD